MTTRALPKYVNPCLSYNPTVKLFYLVSVTEFIQGRLELNSIDLKDIDNPVVQLLTAEVDPQHWNPNAPKLCINYPGSLLVLRDGNGGTNVLPNPRIYMQQFTESWSFGLNALPGDVRWNGVGGNAVFEIPKVGFSGSTELPMWTPILRDDTDIPPAVAGHITVFDSQGTTGQIFPTLGLNNSVQLSQPYPVQMNNIALSSFAIPVHQDATAYILDQV
ncbi:hypothetical protein FBU30_002895 [Linnemannia zychae]|nr:hypothetical protein FBU30_002895 [Linnemannia zychae]